MSDSFNPHRVRTVRGCVHRECGVHARYARFSQAALVMAGIVPAIHVLITARPQDVDARLKAGHDE